MKRHVEVLGREELGELFRQALPNEARNAARAATYQIATEVRDDMKEAIKKRTGKASATIRAVRRNSPPDAPVSEVRGGHEAPYLFMLNYGTSRTQAQPFIEPVVEATRPTLPERYRELVGEKIEAAARRKAKAAKA